MAFHKQEVLTAKSIKSCLVLTCTAASTSIVSGYILTMDFRLSRPALSSSVVLLLSTRTKAVDPMDKLTLILRLFGVSLPAFQVESYRGSEACAHLKGYQLHGTVQM